MHEDYPFAEKKKPFYGKWWFVLVVLMGILYATSVIAPPVLDKRLQDKFESKVIIMYKWTDEKGVVSYSDKKPDTAYEEVPFISNAPAPETLDLVEMKALMTARKIRPILGIVLLAFTAAVVLVQGLRGTASALRRLREKREAKAFAAAIEWCVGKTSDFAAGLMAGDVDKKRYTESLQDIRAALEEISQNPRAQEYEYSRIIENLRLAFEKYVDCLTLWDVKSQRDIVTSDNKDFLIKYPALLDRTTGADKPLSTEEVRKAVKTAIWKYASSYVLQAERLLASASNERDKPKPEKPGDTKDA